MLFRSYGASRLPWLSGSASWAYYTVTQYILGVQPDYHGLKIDPCIPSNWKELKISRIFRKKRFDITIRNESGVEKGVKKIVLNGKDIEGMLIPSDQMKVKNEILVVMGR